MRFQRNVLIEFNKKIPFYVCIWKTNRKYINQFLSCISKSGLCGFYSIIPVITSFYIWKNIKILKHYLSVPTSSEEKLVVRTPITRPNNSTVHSSDFVGEGKETENWVWKKHVGTTHKAEDAVLPFFLPVKKLCLSAIFNLRMVTFATAHGYANDSYQRLREHSYCSSRKWLYTDQSLSSDLMENISQACS